MKNLIIILFLIPLSFTGIGQTPMDTLTSELEAIAKKSAIPGFSVALVSKDRILYQHGFGYADLETKRTFKATTIQNIGSVTKTLIAVSLMQLVEKEKIGLDDNINLHLPFKVTNPYFKDIPITIRQLATHTSSLTDGADDMKIEYTYLFQGDIEFKPEELPDDYDTYFKIYQQNQPKSMGNFLKDIYTPNGEWYEKENFLNKKPGTTYYYSNAGATLLAYLIEQVSGQKFEEYTREYIFKPLKMNNSGWSVDEFEEEEWISHYLSNGLKIPKYELITKPDGGLMTSVSDFGLYLMDMIKGLNGEGVLMKPQSYQIMLSNQLVEDYFPEGEFETSKGLMWNVNREGDNIGANGADPGIATYTLFTTQGNVGLVIFMNATVYDNDEMEKDFKRIRGTLFKNVGKLLKYYKK